MPIWCFWSAKQDLAVRLTLNNFKKTPPFRICQKYCGKLYKLRRVLPHEVCKATLQVLRIWRFKVQCLWRNIKINQSSNFRPTFGTEKTPHQWRKQLPLLVATNLIRFSKKREMMHCVCYSVVVSSEAKNCSEVQFSLSPRLTPLQLKACQTLSRSVRCMKVWIFFSEYSLLTLYSKR